jgi:integrase
MTQQLITPAQASPRKGRKTETAPIPWKVATTLVKAAISDDDPRTALLLGIGIYTGLRIGDVLNLTWQDVEGPTIDLVEGKTKKTRRITINPALASIIATCRPKNATGYIFTYRNTGRPITVPAINRRLAGAFEKYGIEVQNPSAHTLRKTFGRAIWEANGKTDEALVLLSQMFNHRDTATTRRYIGITAERIADAYLTL